MEIVLLYILAASGLGAVSSLAGRQFHFVYDLKNWTEALSYCREKYTDLASIDDMKDVTILNNMADLSKMVYPENSYRAWIGLYDEVNSWSWSMSDRDFYKHDEAEFRNWFPGEPNNEGSVEQCGLMLAEGLWNDCPCDERFKAICSEVQGPNVKFILINKPMTWTEAQSYCRTHYTDLATVRNMPENEKIQKMKPKGQEVWIGLFRESWKWTDGRDFSFRYWSTNSQEPNNEMGEEACVAANFGVSGRWEDWKCNGKKASVCYSAVAVSKKMVRLKLVKTSSLDLNDPVVMEDLLKQLRQKLKEQGVNGDVKLSWRKQSDGTVFHKEEKTKKRDTSSEKDEL